MAIYAISDLHLSFGVNKPMDIFGEQWKNYEKKIKKDWQNKVTNDDFVILAGDFSWAMHLEEAKKDFDFLNALPGKKILSKGNHDYWWETVTKMNAFLKENSFQNITFLHNNMVETNQYAICGTRYWMAEETTENEKIRLREIERAKNSLKAGCQCGDKPIIMVTHYPPDTVIWQETKEYPIQKWVYAHVHSHYESFLVQLPGIETYLTSADYLQFQLIKIAEDEKETKE